MMIDDEEEDITARSRAKLSRVHSFNVACDEHKFPFKRGGEEE